MDGGITPAHELRQARLAVVREHQGRALEAWLMEATRGGIAELACFPQGRKMAWERVRPHFESAGAHTLKLEGLGRLCHRTPPVV